MAMTVTQDEAAAFLLHHFGGEATAPSPVGRGEWSKAYSFRRGDSEYIIRFSEIDEDFAKDGIAARYCGGSRIVQ